MYQSLYPGQLSELHDEALLEHFRQGHVPAFEELYKRFWAALYLHAYRLLEHEQDAQDVVQEVFTAIWTKAGDIELTGSLAAYLYVAVRNRVLNLVARKRTYRQHLDSLQQFMAETDHSLLQHLSEKEMAAQIELEISRLPPRMREVFELSRKTALSHREIASRLQLSQETVKKQISNAIRTLRQKVSHYLFLF
ncbi:RNA polymerase sigma factor [Chitinophaga japonensis]|uniref:RNA polymerase sigma-70 factor (ECF subfamily) n=1 Tax=Chitinophaga japonensis TaxID=104662 RepID=A0A562T0Z2_CHIJA|nr:RNA polymerase sigma-70 factor [Chitinophaga japonensis]TWI86706.1 RNA polymerase sigma-70 factor (ECF subfamily) [Chitinophaga japonensis]